MANQLPSFLAEIYEGNLHIASADAWHNPVQELEFTITDLKRCPLADSPEVHVTQHLTSRGYHRQSHMELEGTMYCFANDQRDAVTANILISDSGLRGKIRLLQY